MSGLAGLLAHHVEPGLYLRILFGLKLAAARLKIKYDAKTDDPDPAKNYPARNEAAPLVTLGQTIADLWPRARGIQPYIPFQERIRPFEEVRVAAWVRAVHSKRQLKEVLVDFWHNHFNVNINSSTAIAATLPLSSTRLCMLRARASKSTRSIA